MLLVFFFQKFQKNLKTFNPTAAFSYVHICYYFEIDIFVKDLWKVFAISAVFLAYLTEKKSVYIVSNYRYLIGKFIVFCH